MDNYADCVSHGFECFRKEHDCYVLLCITYASRNAFRKNTKVDMFCKDNPFSSLSVVAALNQLMYLPIVLWTMYAVPDKMIMVYAIVVGAHFLPYYWIYFSPTYFYASIIIPIVSLMFGIYFSQIIVCVAFVAFDILICILLCLENKQAKKHLKAIANKE